MLRVAVILLLLILLLGAGGYFAFHYITSRGGNTTNTGANGEATPTQAPLTTTPINTTVTYASVNITIINAQQATSFADDKDTPAQGVVRLNLHAVQSDVNNVYSASAPSFAYPECFALLLPGGSKVASGGYKDLSGPVRKGNQTTWIDFPASTGLKVNQMILQIGKDTEEQLQVPLTGHADLSQYQPRQVSPNTRVAYGPLFWTLTTASIQLSDDGKQADKGMRFIVVTLKIENPSTQDLHTYPPDYVRLQAGGGTIAPEGNTAIPLQFAAGTTNTTGSAAFLVPENETSFTLILLANGSTGADKDASINFQIP